METVYGSTSAVCQDDLRTALSMVNKPAGDRGHTWQGGRLSRPSDARPKGLALMVGRVPCES